MLYDKRSSKKYRKFNDITEKIFASTLFLWQYSTIFFKLLHWFLEYTYMYMLARTVQFKLYIFKKEFVIFIVVKIQLLLAKDFTITLFPCKQTEKKNTKIFQYDISYIAFFNTRQT